MYAFSVNGPFDPERGMRFNRHKALIDPYAKAIIGNSSWNELLSGYDVRDPKTDSTFDETDSCRIIPKSVVVDTAYDWGDDKPPRIPWSDTVIYELHVKGFTKLHKNVEENKRGTFEGLSSPIIVNYLKDIGVTAVELLPVQQHFDEKFLVEHGLENYWGYNTIGFFAPDNRYARVQGKQVHEFKDMVRALHRSGIEVMLDVVYNHSGEGDHLGPTMSFRGTDNSSYYKLARDSPRFYTNFTGTGNTINMGNHAALQLVIDSLRYWIGEMHVDGFRFDLATSLARDDSEFSRFATFLRALESDPVISSVKLIAEPWDVGPGGYQLGKFPSAWSEWNAEYRDFARKFWRGEELSIREIAFRIAGSKDIFGNRPYASINYVTCHDGFTLEDLVSYDWKHNEANLEGGNDGSDQNFSWNCDVEGKTSDDKIIELRERQKKNFLAMLLFSGGVPMVLAGDELGRSQRGNNNAYCQDNEISWVDWNLSEKQRNLLGFIRKVVDLRRNHPVLRSISKGNLLHDSKDAVWLLPDGEVTEKAWNDSKSRTIGLLLKGEESQDDTFLLLFNASPDLVHFSIPEASESWEIVLQTRGENLERRVSGGRTFGLEGRSVILMRTI
jgi:glycogen operon protein